MLRILMLTVCCLITINQTLLAQTMDLESYHWEESPNFEVPKTEKEFSEVIVKENRVIQIVKIVNGYNWRLEQQNLEHKVVYIASEDGVNSNNKIYLPKYGSDEILFQKARVINSKGEIIEFDKKDIKEGVDEESGYEFNYFALEGLDIGSFVETIFLSDRTPRTAGVKITLQDKFPKYNVDFELICPDDIKFSFLTVNGLPEVADTDADALSNNYKVHVDYLPALEEEPFSYRKNNLQYLIYKLTEIDENRIKYTFQYKDLAKNYFAFVYDDISGSEKKSIKSLLKKIDLAENLSNLEKVVQIEHYLKKHFKVVENVAEENDNLSSALSIKTATNSIISKIYANLFELLEIPHDLVFTCNRSQFKFDKDFEALPFIQELFIYLPDEDKFLSPQSGSLRLGFIPSTYTANYAVFLTPLHIGKIKTPISKVKFIEPLHHSTSAHNHYIKVDMTEDPNEPHYDFDVHYLGHRGAFLQTQYQYFSDDRKEKRLLALTEEITKETELGNLKIINADPKLFGVEPLKVQVSLNTINFTEKAGNKILFKVGELIGSQAEMYSDSIRIMPVENWYNRTYDRKIEITLPEGYKVSNLEKLNLDFKMSDGTSQFVSTYTLEGNKLTILVDEFYNKINYAIEEFEDFKKVVNAAADFNKVVLYLTKE